MNVKQKKKRFWIVFGITALLILFTFFLSRDVLDSRLSKVNFDRKHPPHMVSANLSVRLSAPERISDSVYGYRVYGGVNGGSSLSDYSMLYLRYPLRWAEINRTYDGVFYQLHAGDGQYSSNFSVIHIPALEYLYTTDMREKLNLNTVKWDLQQNSYDQWLELNKPTYLRYWLCFLVVVILFYVVAAVLVYHYLVCGRKKQALSGYRMYYLRHPDRERGDIFVYVFPVDRFAVIDCSVRRVNDWFFAGSVKKYVKQLNRLLDCAKVDYEYVGKVQSHGLKFDTPAGVYPLQSQYFAENPSE